MKLRPDIKAIRARLDATTPGPWVKGGYYSFCGANDGKTTHLYTSRLPLGRCHRCKDEPEPCAIAVTRNDGLLYHGWWMGLDEMEATSRARALEEGEEYPEESYVPRGWHHIASSTTYDPITGNFDYEEGGVCSTADDAAFIENAPTDVHDLLLYVAELERREARDDTKEVERLRAEVAKLRDQLTFQRESNEKRNRELDALHYVWCNGGCEKGVHRYGEHPPLTDEIVTEAIRNTNRLISWHGNHKFKELPIRERFDHIETSRIREENATLAERTRCATVCKEIARQLEEGEHVPGDVARWCQREIERKGNE